MMEKWHRRTLIEAMISNHRAKPGVKCLLVAICCIIPVLAPAQTNPFVHQSGGRIVDSQGRPLQLRGVNLGGWLLWEGWILGKGFVSQSALTEKFTRLVGQEDVERFRDKFETNFVNDDDLARIEALGFNCVRVPFSWRLFEQPNGWRLMDQFLDNCERHHVYAVLDMHSAPGGQNRFFISDPGSPADLLWVSSKSREHAVALWKKIALRYRDRPIVAGYDVINEPNAPAGAALVDLYKGIIDAIRSVDTNHMIILEGNKFATDFSMFSGPLTGNEAYSFHIYNWFGDDRARNLARYHAVSVAQNVPMWCGEFGENKYDMIRSTVQMFESPKYGFSGWAFWTWKRAPGSFPGLITIKLPPKWVPVINWAGSWLAWKPNPTNAAAGFDDFVQAVRLQNCQLDEQMVEALQGKVNY
jgi:endoglucanase